jgi:hypothetical protein
VTVAASITTPSLGGRIAALKRGGREIVPSLPAIRKA